MPANLVKVICCEFMDVKTITKHCPTTTLQVCRIMVHYYYGGQSQSENHQSNPTIATLHHQQPLNPLCTVQMTRTELPRYIKTPTDKQQETLKCNLPIVFGITNTVVQGTQHNHDSTGFKGSWATQNQTINHILQHHECSL